MPHSVYLTGVKDGNSGMNGSLAGQVVTAAALGTQKVNLVVHPWYTEEPEPDKQGLIGTKAPFQGRPAAIGLSWSHLVWFCLAWKPCIGLENRRPFTHISPSVLESRPLRHSRNSLCSGGACPLPQAPARDAPTPRVHSMPVVHSWSISSGPSGRFLNLQ